MCFENEKKQYRIEQFLNERGLIDFLTENEKYCERMDEFMSENLRKVSQIECELLK